MKIGAGSHSLSTILKSKELWQKYMNIHTCTTCIQSNCVGSKPDLSWNLGVSTFLEQTWGYRQSLFISLVWMFINFNVEIIYLDHGMPSKTLLEYYIVHDICIITFLYLENAVFWNKSSPKDFGETDHGPSHKTVHTYRNPSYQFGILQQACWKYNFEF